MTITVTAEYIRRGRRCDSFRCPLALAFNAAGFDVMIGPALVDFYDGKGDVCATFPLPIEAIRFQRQYDDLPPRKSAPRDMKWPAPFAFEMPDLEPGVEPFTHFRSVAVANALFGGVTA
jgi:hypothetical protein